MPGKATRLQRATEKLAVRQDQLILQFESELQSVLRRADRFIAGLVRQLAQEDGRLVRTRAALGRAIRMRQDLAAALTDSGFVDLAERATIDRFDAIANAVLKDSAIAAKAANLTAVNVRTLTALKSLRLAELLDWRDGVAVKAWRITVDGVMGLRPVDDLVADLAKAVDTSLPTARTLYDTGLSTFSREVDLLNATGDPDELFYYAGPLDSVTRDFCRKHVGKVYGREVIEGLDNGQLPDPLVTGGGYNCRHAFKRVSILDDELRGLHESGSRLPHVEQRRKALNKAA